MPHSYLQNLSFQHHSEQIIHLNLEDVDYEFKNYKELYNYIINKIDSDKQYYVFLDEVQNVFQFQKAVDSLYIKKNIDVYITGSNAYLLSGELATLLSGRYIEIKMYPLSFKEFLKFNHYDESGIEDKFYEYMKYGGLPAITLIKDKPDLVMSYLEDIYNTIVKKDIIDRNGN